VQVYIYHSSSAILQLSHHLLVITKFLVYFIETKQKFHCGEESFPENRWYWVHRLHCIQLSPAPKLENAHNYSHICDKSMTLTACQLHNLNINIWSCRYFCSLLLQWLDCTDRVLLPTCGYVNLVWTYKKTTSVLDCFSAVCCIIIQTFINVVCKWLNKKVLVCFE